MDPISDMFIRIKNATKAGKDSVQTPYSKYRYAIARVLEREGWVGSMERKGKKIRKTLEVKLNPKNSLRLKEVKLISKPSRRLYTPYKGIPKARHGGILLISTSKGVMSGEEAKKAKLGGELIAEIW